MAHCSNLEDAEAASAWLLDRLTRLAPNTEFKMEITPDGGQFLLKLSTS